MDNCFEKGKQYMFELMRICCKDVMVNVQQNVFYCNNQEQSNYIHCAYKDCPYLKAV